VGAAVGKQSLALALGQTASSLLYGVSPRDPAAFGAVAMTLALVALAASLIPARRVIHYSSRGSSGGSQASSRSGFFAKRFSTPTICPLRNPARSSRR